MCIGCDSEREAVCLNKNALRKELNNKHNLQCCTLANKHGANYLSTWRLFSEEVDNSQNTCKPRLQVCKSRRNLQGSFVVHLE